MVFYTYVHHRADDGKVFYVGKGKGSAMKGRPWSEAQRAAQARRVK
jgi:hypothetical protein